MLSKRALPSTSGAKLRSAPGTVQLWIRLGTDLVLLQLECLIQGQAGAGIGWRHTLEGALTASLLWRAPPESGVVKIFRKCMGAHLLLEPGPSSAGSLRRRDGPGALLSCCVAASGSCMASSSSSSSSGSPRAVLLFCSTKDSLRAPACINAYAEIVCALPGKFVLCLGSSTLHRRSCWAFPRIVSAGVSRRRGQRAPMQPLCLFRRRPRLPLQCSLAAEWRAGHLVAACRSRKSSASCLGGRTPHLRLLSLGSAGFLAGAAAPPLLASLSALACSSSSMCSYGAQSPAQDYVPSCPDPLCVTTPSVLCPNLLSLMHARLLP